MTTTTSDARLNQPAYAYTMTTTNAMTLAEVRNAFDASSYSLKHGVFTVRRGFYYTGGFTAEMYAAKVKAAFPSATIVESGEVWKAFRGGASVAQQSHWFVKFTFATQVPS